MPTVNNHDIAGLCNRINRFIVEVEKAVSSGTSKMSLADQTRLLSFLNVLDGYKKWSVSQPDLDLPETHPRPIELEENAKPVNVENESSNDVIKMFEIMRDELANCQSARDAAGLNEFDSVRFTSMSTKIRNFVNEYIAKSTPVDLPESSPREASSGAGRTGI